MAILESHRPLAGRYRHLTIDRDAVSGLARFYLASARPPPSFPVPHHAQESREALLWYFTVACALMFRFWHRSWSEVWEHHGRREVGALWHVFRLYPDLLDPKFLCTITTAGVIAVFGDIPMPEHRVVVLRELGRIYPTLQGGLTGVFEAAGWEAEASALALGRTFPTFRDEAGHPAAPAPLLFYTRAQQCIACIEAASPGTFRTLDGLTLFPDCMVPRALRHHGVLRYGPDLAAAVDEGREIPAGSPMEVELRSATVWAGHLLLQDVRARGGSVEPRELHHWLWREGVSLSNQPHHLTVTTMY